MKNKNIIKREFTIPKDQGAAALFAASTAEGLPLISMSRKGSKVVCLYGKPKTLDSKSELHKSN